MEGERQQRTTCVGYHLQISDGVELRSNIANQPAIVSMTLSTVSKRKSPLGAWSTVTLLFTGAQIAGSVGPKSKMQRAPAAAAR